jgi:hypothetical protein
MLASGDWEQMEPLFEFYGRTLPLAKARTELTMGHKVCRLTRHDLT